MPTRNLSWWGGPESLVVLGAATILALAGCGGSPSLPDDDGLAGRWEGQFHQVACSTTQIDSRPCAYYPNGVLKLDIAGADEATTGRLTVTGFEYPDAPIWNTPVTLKGTVDGNRVSLTAVVNSAGGFSDQTTAYALEGDITASGSMKVTFSVRDRSLAADWQFEREAEGWLRR